jgi:oligopeptide transport system permease protein
MDRYFEFLGRVFTKWDWGTSEQLKLGTGAMQMVMERLPVSIKINLIATVISVPLGILLGVYAALNKDKPVDYFINVIIMIFISIPSFVIITYLILWFAYGAHVLPYRRPEAISDSATMAKAYVIPVLSLSIGTIAGFARFVRAELCEVMSSDYLLLARTKGLTRRQAIVHHALRNSMVPVVPMIVAEFFSILGGSIILEQIYNIQGIGSLYMSAFAAKDYNVLMADMAFYTIIGLAASILVDLSYGFIDPRIRMGER